MEEHKVPPDKPLERRLVNDGEAEPSKSKRSDSGEPEDAAEQSTLVLNAKDAGELFEFSGNDNKKFRKLFALIADLYTRQGQQGQSQQLPAAGAPKQPVIS